jgi:uncharacterized repeat protein (TIGR03809 family)
MPSATIGFDSDRIARRWLALADRRLLYFGELYRSGRWMRYYTTPEEFAEQMHKAVKAAQIWARLAGTRGRVQGSRNDLHATE